jgi:hypothetical protein
MHPELAASLRRNDDNYRAAGQALDHYLSRVLGESVNGLTRSQLADRLHHHGLNEAWISRITEFQARCEMGRYSQPPSPDAGWHIMAAADQLLFGLDQLLGSDEKETG